MAFKYRLLHGVGLSAMFRRLNRERVSVLMYHGVLPDDDSLAEDDWLQVRLSEFRRQMDFLRRNYAVIHFADALAGPVGGKCKDRPRAIITFDDGYANNCHWALPVLQALGLPATVFVSTAFLDTRRLFWWDRLRLSLAAVGRTVPVDWVVRLKGLHPSAIDEALDGMLAAAGVESCNRAPESYRCLNSGELQTLRDSGLIQIGSHTHGHEILERLSDAEVSATLAASQEALAARGGATALFAAPNGSYASRQTALMRTGGFALCAATDPVLWRCPGNPYRIPRLPVGRGSSEAQFALQLSGALAFLKNPADVFGALLSSTSAGA